MTVLEELTPEGFVAEWGAASWTRLTRASAFRWPLPKSTAEFLIRAGLPRQTMLLFSFDLDRGFDELPGAPTLLAFGSDEWTRRDRSRLSMLDSTIDDDADSWWRLVTDQAVDGLL